MATLNHIGIAVADLPGMKKLFSLLNLTVDHEEKVPEQGLVAHFIALPAENAHLELLEPVDPKGVIAQFLSKRGPGIHHLSFQVKNGELDPLCERLRSAGLRLIYERPQLGAQGMKINFIHPSSCGGILIEVMEPAEYII